MSVKTVENHLTRIYKQLGVQSRLEAVNFILHYPQILGKSGLEAAREDTTSCDQSFKKAQPSWWWMITCATANSCSA